MSVPMPLSAMRRCFLVCLGSLLLRPVQAQLTPPTAVEAIAFGQREVRVYWNPAPGAVRYRITRDGQQIGAVEAEAREFTDTTAQPGQTYRYSVTAVDANGAEATGRPYVERSFPVLPEETRCDVLVVGANAAGVSAAASAGRYGLNVVLTEATRRLGGMAVNGLGASDIRRIGHASGFFEEFRRKVVELYGEGNGLRYEPRVAHQAIKEILWGVPGLTVHRQVRPVKVATRDRRIVSVEMEEVVSGRRVTLFPRLVVDASECGDVAAWAGAPFRVGREPRSAREPHAGVIYYDRASDSRMPGSTGEGDHRVQAYSYLMVVKDFGPGADRTIPRPPGYDPAKYRGAPRWPDSWNATSGKLPNDKYEINQHPHGSDLQGTNYAYPTASYAERQRMEQEFKDHALGYLYFMQTAQGMKNLGLSEDDYRDSDGWPTLLYVREARRFLADVTMDETDIRDARKVARPNAIGIGDYAMDSHATQPAPDFDHYARPPKHMGEGEFYLPQYTPWHQVPYPIMIPRRVENVFTPTAVSATHVAYGTYRMEPVRMHFGTAAGVAAYLCLRYNLAPRDVPVRQIQAELLKSRAGTAESLARDGIGSPGPTNVPTFLYMFSDLALDAPRFQAIQWLGARGFYPCPPPAQRTPSSGLEAAPFRSEETLTEAEAARGFALLAARADAGGIWAAYRPRGPEAEAVTEATGSETLTRGRAAQMLARFLDWQAPPGAAHYADLSPDSPHHAAAEALFARWIDSRLWDGEQALAPEGRFYFRPDAPLTRGQFAQLLHLAHTHLGPLWKDHPVDRQAIPIP